MMGEDGRSALTGVLEAGRMAPRLDARTYFNLVRILEAAMRGVLEQNDMQNASANSTCQYGRCKDPRRPSVKANETMI